MATKYSNPVLDQPLTLQTEYAQRVFDRSFARTARSLHAIDVILRIIGEDEEVDEVEKVIDDMIVNWKTDIEAEKARLTEIGRAGGVERGVAYTSPMDTSVQVSSPQVSRLLDVMRLYDALVAVIDGLWIHGLLENKNRRQLIFDWQRRTLRLGNRIVDLEQRAHRAAKAKGKEEEVAASIPKDDADDTASKADPQPEHEAKSEAEPA